MAFLNKNVLQDVSDKTVPSQSEGKSDGTVDLQTRQAYLEGCILAAKSNGSIDSEDARRMLDAVGRSFKMGKDEIVACYDVVSSLNSSDENEFVDMVVTAVKAAGLSLRFLFDVETCVSEKSRIGATTYTLIYRYVKGLSVDENTWRVQVFDLARQDDNRKRWIDCCREAAKVWSAHDAKYALAYWHSKGIGVGLDDAEAEKLYEQSAKNGNAEAQKAVDEIKTKRAEEERIRAKNEAKRRAAEEQKRAREEAKRRAEIEEMLLVAGKVGLGLLPIILVVWLICHWHNQKVERINTAANSILQSMVSIPGVKFKMGKTEVTQAQWYGITGENPSKHEGDNLPVENVSWNDCQDFLEDLNKSDAVKKSQMRRFRLPTESEWEYACRAGGKGDVGLTANGSEGNLSDMAWFNCGATHPVATKQPNAYGLYDMHGNVFEWCSDIKKGLLIDDRVNKGGAFDKSSEQCSASFQDSDPPRMSFRNTGLRVVCD